MGCESCCCSATQQQVDESQLALAELDVLKLTTIPVEQIKRKNVVFSFRNGEPVSVRTFILSDQLIFNLADAEDEARSKPTLVFIHGFGGSACLMYPIYKELVKHFRVVAIDMLGYGASSRVVIKPEILASPAATDNYQISWLSMWLNQMSLSQDLPEKFYLHGHSYGGYLSALFACNHPERISALFLNSAIGAEPEPAEYDPTQIRLSSGDKGPPPKLLSEFWKMNWEANRTPLDVVRVLPDCLVGRVQNYFINKDMDGYPPRHRDVVRRYVNSMFKLGASGTEKALTATFKFGCFPHHCLTEVDRLGNPHLPFPIAFCYGDQDWLGTVGADQIVRGNKFFSEGLSQIFILEGSDHVTYLDNPDQLVDYIIGFFNQTLKDQFNTKPRSTIKETYTRQNSVKKPKVVIEEDNRTPERARNLRKPSECITPKMFASAPGRRLTQTLLLTQSNPQVDEQELGSQFFRRSNTNPNGGGGQDETAAQDQILS